MNRMLSAACAIVFMTALAWAIDDVQLALTPEGYFEGPGVDFLVYHNTYLGGRQGGLQLLLHGTRVIDAGTLWCRTADDKRHGFFDDDEKAMGERRLDMAAQTVSLPFEFKTLSLKHELAVSTKGPAITVTVKLDEPVDWTEFKECVFKMEIFPEAYFGKTYLGGGVSGYFTEKDMGHWDLIPAADKIVVAPEDPLRTLVFEANNASLSLHDFRRNTKATGYMVFAALPSGSNATEFSMTITSKPDPTWRRTPVIELSQVGYHPRQEKVALLELDKRTEAPGEMRLMRLDESGIQQTAKSGVPEEWGPLFDYKYCRFDFTEVTEPGLYYLRYGDQQEGPFRIGEDALRGAWEPTMDFFFPAQMCHVKVRDFLVVWHGACHVDDALQAPPGKQVIDGYRQGPATDTPFKGNEHVLGLDWGGWHDAADFDLPSGAIADVVQWMALAFEEFHPDRDRVTIKRGERLVELNEPDGKNDLLQQVAFGMEFLLGMHRAFGHVGGGIIANTGPDYGRMNDPCSITDSLVYDPSLKPDERKCDRSGKFDDRWVFTNRNTGSQYQFAQSAAIASRALRGFDDTLAAECLDAAGAAWDYEQTHDQVDFACGYNPQESKLCPLELGATAELYMTTGGEKYRGRLLALTHKIEHMPPEAFGRGTGFVLARALDKMQDEPFRKAVTDKAMAFHDHLKRRLAENPFGVEMDFAIWGINWNVQQLGSRLYFFHKQFPGVFESEWLYNALHYTFGRHPATSHSFVSGVGAKSATVAYGFNRDASTYIPGGVVSGVSLIRPKFPDYRARPWDWYQTEYVINGSASYVFNVLAANALLAQ